MHKINFLLHFNDISKKIHTKYANHQVATILNMELHLVLLRHRIKRLLINKFKIFNMKSFFFSNFFINTHLLSRKEMDRWQTPKSSNTRQSLFYEKFNLNDETNSLCQRCSCDVELILSTQCIRTSYI